MRVFIKQTAESSLFEQAKVGFIKMGYECIYYVETPEDLNSDDVLVGHISDVRKAYLKLGISIPSSVDYPEELQEFLAREIRIINYQELPEDKFPYFIKPVNHKLFEGRVVREFKDLIGICDTELYYTEDILNIESEYRVYIQDREIIGIKHYKGTPYKVPQEKTIEEIINSYHSQPNTYTIDIGITTDNKNILIEVNDGYSSGNYGLTEIQYAKFLREGYRQYIERG